jgi:RNA polymerase sigma factor (sigma-70 family)
MEAPPATLLERVALGDMAAVQACIDEYGGLVWSLARRFLAVPSEAEDAVQEVFITLWENAGRYDRSKGAEVTFVAMIARRRLIDRSRRRGRRDRLIAEAKEAARSGPTCDDVGVTTQVDEARRAMAAMEQLSQAQQRVLRLAIHQGLTHEQIATATNLPLGTVKTHARRGLERVRALLGESATGETTRSGR